MTLYDELELSPNCTMDQIKLKYRILAGIHHPDKGGDEERFKRIKFAYEVLSDPVRRKQYDENKTTDVPNDKRFEAINHLSHIFSNIMPNFDPNQGGNLIDIMKNEITKSRLLILADISRAEDYIKKLELTQSKTKLKKPTDENVINSFIEAQISYRMKDIEVFKNRLEVVDLMENIIDNYQYGFLELFNELSSTQPDVGSEPIVS